MYRSAKINRVIVILMTLCLLLSVPVALMRARRAASQVTGRERTLATGLSGKIVDREGNPLSSGGTIVSTASDSMLVALQSGYAAELAPALSSLRGIGDTTGTMRTTLLPDGALHAVTDAFGAKDGAAFAYNYETGEIYSMVSVDHTGGGMNRCLLGSYIPGSTMKVVASLVALEQGKDLSSFFYQCEGDERCSYLTHGGLDFDAALGYSCNAFFYEMISTLNIPKAQESLSKLGFHQGDGVETEPLGDLVKSVSSTSFTSAEDGGEIWSLIGQGSTTVNLMDMAQIAGAVANGGSAAVPRIVRDVVDDDGTEILAASEPELVERCSAATAEEMDARWSDMTDTYYRGDEARCVGDLITMAKTGTAQRGEGMHPNKLLLGVSKDTKTAFMIVVEDYDEAAGDVLPQQIANVLMEQIYTNTQTKEGGSSDD